MIFYKVNEDRCYVNLPGGFREDVGICSAERVICKDFKELAKKFSGMSENYIEENVFENEEEANMFALKLSCDKLAAVYNKVKKA